ncbi:MAG: 3-dehydroquinate synthase [Lacunisphaera sp.]
MHEGLTVKLSEKNYPIQFANETWGGLGATLKRLGENGRRSALLTDQTVWQALPLSLREIFKEVPRLELPAGEKTKSLAELGRVLDFMAAERLDRSSVLWILGGGVIGDLGGFAAASYLRGIEFVQVPTTLLAMVDSSIGGKTGINLAAGKNLVGAFHHPSEVFLPVPCLRTLPPREFAAGMAEVIKYGLLGDAALFGRLEQAPLTVDSPDLARVIHRCCEMKAAIVQADERETAREGGRALLNLGHTFGHAIEQVTGYGTYLHGEAVAIGLVAAARLSAKLGPLPAGDVARVEHTVAAHQLPVRLRTPSAIGRTHGGDAARQKSAHGQLRFIILLCLGEAATRAGVDPALVESVWRELGTA